MKIEALRVREVGPFREPVALEGFSGALDVLAGPNEMGKSTLFRALDAAFTLPHTSGKKDARAWMVPTSGGAPVIEVDFSLGSKRWRLRKRYMTGPRAVLKRLDGDDIMRGGDAEDALAALMAEAGGPGRMGLLFVAQTAALSPFQADADESDSLKGLIADEVQSATGGGRVAAIGRKVRERMDDLVTGARRQPKGAYKEANEERERLTAEVAARRDGAARARERIERQARLVAEEAALSDPAVRGARAERLAKARERLEAGRAGAGRRRAAEERWKAADSIATAAARARETFDRLQAEDVARAGIAPKLAEARAAQLAAAGAAALVRQRETLTRRIADLSARGAASSVRVAIAYDRGVAGRITQGGAEIGKDGFIDTSAELTLVIDGVGRITITPPRAEEGARLEAERAAAGAELAALPPAPDQVPDGTAVAAFATQVQELENRQRASDLAAERLRAELGLLIERSGIAPLAEETATRHRAALAQAAAETAGRARETLLALTALREAEPDATSLAALEAEALAAAADEAKVERRAKDLAVELAGLATHMQRDDEEGLDTRLESAEAALIAATRRTETLQRRVAGLIRLDDELSAAARASSDTWLGPVTDRLAPYLGLVLPEAQLDLAEGFAAASLTRGGRSEDEARLSHGTREQIAVLVRLGLGRLMAERGRPLPLVLDDALVYSDDRRIEAAFAALDAASRHHQVVVLTCREKAFAGLGGTRLALAPWEFTEA